jgi:hypothetical protein
VPKVVQITDWLPPDFSAVSQYALLRAEQDAETGSDVTVIGLTTGASSTAQRRIGLGSVSVIAIRRRLPDKQNWTRRLLWTLATNAVLVARARRYIGSCDVIRFMGSPPFMLHFIIPANVIWRKPLHYRITDFYPECIIAALGRQGVVLGTLLRLTNVLRRRIDHFEVIGEDMRLRLLNCGVPREKITLSRDGAPVPIDPAGPTLPRPPGLEGRKLLLYSGNWGVAHEVDTFFEGYKLHHQSGAGTIVLWLNATGSGAEELERKLSAEDLPFYRQKLVPLNQLSALLVSPDAHLITLRPAFLGYVLPSKVYGCLRSRKPIIYVGPRQSDVHSLCSEDPTLWYRRVDIGDVATMAETLDEL